MHQDAIGLRRAAPLLSWIGPRRFTLSETNQLRQATRFAAAPLAVFAVRDTLTATVEAYLGRRSAARLLAAPLRRGIPRPSRQRCWLPICAALRPYPIAIPRPRSSRLSIPGSIASPARFTSLAARC